MNAHETDTSSDEELLTVELSTEDVNVSTAEVVNVSAVSDFPSKIYAAMETQGKTVKMQIDSGASCNVPPKEYLPEGTEVQKTNKLLTAYNKERILALGTARVSMRNPKTRKKYNAEFVVVDGNYTPLIGTRAAQQMGFIVVQHHNIQLVSNSEVSTALQSSPLTKEQVLTDFAVKPDPKKIEAIVNMETPTDVQGVQRLIGMVKYLSKFLSNLSELCQPLRKLTHKDVEWQWTQEQEDTFQSLKTAVTQAPVLKYFSPQAQTEGQGDASQNGLGFVLMQEGQPVTYASHALTPAEHGNTRKDCKNADRLWCIMQCTSKGIHSRRNRGPEDKQVVDSLQQGANSCTWNSKSEHA